MLRQMLNSVYRIIQHIRNALIVTLYYLRWSWRFGSFPFRCRLGTPDNLVNPKAIHFGRKVQIYKGSRLEAIGNTDSKVPKLIIGDNTKIMYYFHCGAAASVRIGRNVLIASRVYITDHDHVFDDPILSAQQNPRISCAPVVIEDGCWIGEGAVILKGLTIGERSVVGANAVVTRDVPPWTLVAGIPAQVIRRIVPIRFAQHNVTCSKSPPARV
jgi:acetyltransferase-like isoleucine patch superfamily enzyme